MTRLSARLLTTVSLALLLTASGARAQTPAQNDSSAAAAGKERSLPLIAARTLDITVDEGTWLSLDLSPDGSTILFELLGDFYTLPIGGGEATRITDGPAYDMQPRYSPDGSLIVFVSDRDGSENLWLANADGTDARSLTRGERENYLSPVFTPDGQYVIATKGSQLWLYHVDGGSGVQLTGHGEGPQPAHMGAAFGNDDRHVWVNLRGSLGGGFDLAAAGFREPWEEDFDETHRARSSARRVGTYQIGQLDRETGRVHVRTHELEGAFRPVASPDGRWLVYATRYDDRSALKLRDLQTGEESWLVMDVQRDDHQGGGSRDRDVYPGSAFTPRLPGAGHHVRRQDHAGRGSVRGGHGDPVHGEDPAGAGASRQVRLPDRGLDADRLADPRCPTVTGWRSRRLRGRGPAVDRRSARGGVRGSGVRLRHLRPSPAHLVGRRGARAGLVTRRSAHRLRDVERFGRRGHLPRPFRRTRVPRTADRNVRLLRQALLLARRLPAARRSRIEDAPHADPGGLRQPQRGGRARIRVDAVGRRRAAADRVGRDQLDPAGPQTPRIPGPMPIGSTCGPARTASCRCGTTERT